MSDAQDVEVPFETFDDSCVHIWNFGEAPEHLRKGMKLNTLLMYVPVRMVGFPWRLLFRSETHVRVEGDGAMVVSMEFPVPIF